MEAPRTGNATRHLLSEIMFIAFLCVLCGGETAVDMADFAEAKEETLREFLQLPFGTPSHDTFSRVFQALDPEAFAVFFARFTSEFRARRDELARGGAIAIDGKTVRGSFDHAAGKSALNMVTAWGHNERLSLGCTGVGKGGEEIIALRRLIALLDIKGQWITADALHCQRETARDILDQGGQYCPAGKGNQGTLHEDPRLFIANPETEITDVSEETGNEHGRVEARTTRVYTDLEWLVRTHAWPGLQAVATVSATRDDGSPQTRIFLLSQAIGAQAAARLVRSHSGIENGLHRVLDVTMNEDAHRARKDNAPMNFTILRRAALNTIKADKPKGSNRIKFKGSICKPYAWLRHRRLEAGSGRWRVAGFDEMEPPEIAVEVLGGDAAEAAQEALDLAVAAVDRLNVQRAPDPLAGRGVDALVRDVERHRDGRIAAVGVGDQQGIRGEDRLQHLLHTVCVERRQGMAEGRAGTVGGDQDRHLLAREAAPSGGSDRTAATSLRCAAVNSSTHENQSRNRS